MRYRRAQPIWTDASFASPGADDRARPARSPRCAPRPPARPPTRRPPRRSPHGRWLFSHNGRLHDWADRPQGAAAAGRRRPRRPGRRGLGAAVRPGRSRAGRPARRCPTGLAGAARGGARARRRAAQPCWPPTATSVAGRRGRGADARARATATAPSSPPSRTTTSPAGARCPTGTVVRRRPRRRCPRPRPPPIRGRTTAIATTHRPPPHARRTSPPSLRARRARRADRDAEGAAAEVLLRRAAAASCSRRSPGCRSTTRPAPRRGILAARAAEIADLTKARTLVELGSGSSEKTHLLLRALRDVGSLEQLRAGRRQRRRARAGAARRWSADYPGLEVHGVVADFERHLDRLPGATARGWSPSSAAPSATSSPAQRAAFLAALGATLRPGDALLLGTDLVKDPARLVRAYDDAAGVTAAFNLQRAARDQPRARRGLRPRRASRTSRCGTPSRSGSRCGCGRCATQTGRRARPGSASVDVRRAARRCAPRSPRSSAGTRWPPSSTAAGLRLAQWWTDQAGDFALSLATPA